MKWFIGAGAILVAALILESSLLAYAMYVLLGLMVLTRLMARVWIGNLHAERECNRYTANVGERIAVIVTIKNHGAWPVPWVLMEDLLPRFALAQKPPRLKVLGKRLAINMLWGRGQTTMRYQLRLNNRGYYQIGPLVFESGDLFGLHRRYRVGTEPHYLLVYPEVVPLEGYDIASRRPIGEIQMSHRLYEDPTRIGGVREYQTGDPLNRVHWRATARTGKMHSKIYDPSTIAGATILLDFHVAGYHSQGEPHRSELAITTAASLANAVYEMGQQIGFVTNGRDAADRIRLEGWDYDFRTRHDARRSAAMTEKSERLQPIVMPTGRGAEQIHGIFSTLARVELTDGLTFAELILETTPRISRDATVIALLPDVSEETAIALGSLRRQGYAVSVVLIAVEDSHLEICHGRLLAEGIRDVRHMKDKQALSGLCQQAVQRVTPYQFQLHG